MSLFQGFGWNWGAKQRIEDLAEQIATQHVEDVLGQLSGQTAHMSPHELRGYIRARAGAVVQRAILEAVHRHSIQGHARKILHLHVLDAVIRRIQRELISSRFTRRTARAA